MTSEFSERVALERGFSRVYGSRIVPQLHILREKRKAVAGRMRRDFTIAAVVTLATAVGGIAVFGQTLGITLALFVAVLAGLGAFMPATRRSDAFARELHQLVLTATAEFLDLRLTTQNLPQTLVLPFMRHGLVEPAARRRLSHQLSGTYRGTGFEVTQAFMERQGSANSSRYHGQVKVFGGLLISIQSPIAAATPVIILPRLSPLAELMAEAFAALPPMPPAEIAIDDDGFASLFTAHCADETVARRFLTPALTGAFRAIEEERARLPPLQDWPAGRIAAAFVEDSFHIAMPRRGFLALGWISDEDIEGRIHAIFLEITLIHRIIDRLHDG